MKEYPSSPEGMKKAADDMTKADEAVDAQLEERQITIEEMSKLMDDEQIEMSADRERLYQMSDEELLSKYYPWTETGLSDNAHKSAGLEFDAAGYRRMAHTVSREAYKALSDSAYGELYKKHKRLVDEHNRAVKDEIMKRMKSGSK